MEQARKIHNEVSSIFGNNQINLVGGSVRDVLLNKTPKDYDFNVSLSPDEIERKVREAGRKPYLTGKRFGTIGLKVPVDKDWHLVEVTTYRTERYDGVSRKPQVEFTDDLDLDLSRRDFTINAIAMLPNGEIYDPFGGKIDLFDRKIKPVGDGKDRINEDPLRMLRAARFASQLDFEVDSNLMGTMRKLAHEVLRVSKERWVAELDKLLGSDNPTKGLDVLIRAGLMKYILPEVYLSLKDDITRNSVYSYLNLLTDRDASLDDRWGALLSFIGHPFTEVENKGLIKYPRHELVRKELTRGICARLRFSNERTKNLV